MLVIYVASALVLASANPVRPRATCSPYNVPLAVINGDREWAVEADSAGVNVVPATTVAGFHQLRFGQEQSSLSPTQCIIQ